MKDVEQAIIDYVLILREEIGNPDHSQWEAHLRQLLYNYQEELLYSN